MNTENLSSSINYIQLYELMQSVGNSLDLTENCRVFFEKLIEQQYAQSCGLWLYSSEEESAPCLKEVTVFPCNKQSDRRIAADHSLMETSEELTVQRFASGQPGYEALKPQDADEGVSWLLPLEGLGWLQLNTQQEAGQSAPELPREIMDKFTFSVKACLQYQQALGKEVASDSRGKSLKERTIQYQHILENIEEGVLQIGLDLKVTYVNSAYCQMMGLEPEQVKGHNTFELFQLTEEEKKLAKNRIKERENGFSERYEYDLTLSNGKTCIVDIYSFPYCDQAGNIRGSILIMKDISEKKKHEQDRLELLQKLVQSNVLLEQQKSQLDYLHNFSVSLLQCADFESTLKLFAYTFSQYFKYASLGIYLFKPESQSLELEAGYHNKQIFYQTEPLESKLACHPLMVHAYETNTSILLQDISKSQWKEQVNKKEGTLLVIPILTADYNFGLIEIYYHLPNYLTKDHQDIFETLCGLVASKLRVLEQLRKQLLIEDSLQKKDRLNKIIMHMALDAVLMISDNDQVMSWNKMAEKIFGYTKKEALYQRIDDLILPEHSKKLYQLKKQETKEKCQVMNWHDANIFYFPAVTKSGEEILVEVSAVYVEEGEFRGYFAYIRDMTQLQKDKLELINARKLAENASKAKDMFLANMSHEIRTPMNAISGMVQLLEKEPLGKREQTYLKTLSVSTDNMMHIIDDILDISKIEAGKLDIEQRPFHLSEIIDREWSALEWRAQQKGLELKLDINPNIFPVLLGDPIRLWQILYNLLDNALKYTSKGQVSLNCMPVADREDSQLVEFQINDTGIGIAAEAHDLIFDNFSQEDASITRKYGGTGLGLSICKRLTELMDGEIEVYSQKDHGSSFRLRLPFKKSLQKVETKRPQPTDYRLKDKRVLVVEDHAFNRLFIVSVLEEQQAQVWVAENGQQALELFEQHTFDIILMDIQMPVLNGMEATRILREEKQVSLPIIAVTANALKGEREKYLNSGFNDYIPKPFDANLLCEKVEQWTGSKSFKSTAMERANHEGLYSIDKLENMSGGNEMLSRKLVSVFIKNTSESLDLMEQKLETKEYAEVQKIAHKLKPSFDMMGVDVAYQQALELEEFSEPDNNLAVFQSHVQELKTIVQQVVKHLREEFTDL